MLLPSVFLMDKTRYLGKVMLLKISGSMHMLKSVYSAQKYSFYNLDRRTPCPFQNETRKTVKKGQSFDW